MVFEDGMDTGDGYVHIYGLKEEHIHVILVNRTEA
jgi:hypothetical protein